MFTVLVFGLFRDLWDFLEHGFIGCCSLFVFFEV